MSQTPVGYGVDTTGYASAFNACANGSVNASYYMAPGNTTPTVGQFVYTNSSLTTAYNGGSNYHLFTRSSSRWGVQVGATGQITAVTDCSTIPSVTPSISVTPPVSTSTTPPVSPSVTPPISTSPTPVPSPSNSPSGFTVRLYGAKQRAATTLLYYGVNDNTCPDGGISVATTGTLAVTLNNVSSSTIIYVQLTDSLNGAIAQCGQIATNTYCATYACSGPYSATITGNTDISVKGDPIQVCP